MKTKAICMLLEYIIIPVLQNIVIKTDNQVDDKMVEWAKTIVSAINGKLPLDGSTDQAAA